MSYRQSRRDRRPLGGWRAARPQPVRRVAVLSVHTSPLAQPGTGDAGGLNVYVTETAKELARRGVEVEIFTRATSSAQEPVVEAFPGVRVRNVVAGPFEGLDKADLPSQLCAFTAGVLRAEARHEPGYYDMIHSHYWLSGQVGWLARDRWGVPLVHTAHTLGAVKNLTLAIGDTPEPDARIFGEQQVVDEADRLIVNTEVEAGQLTRLNGARSDFIDVVPPGVDLAAYRPSQGRGPARAAIRAWAGIDLQSEHEVIAFVGRIQPLKAPDLLIEAAAPILRARPNARLLIVGGRSGVGLDRPLAELAFERGIDSQVVFLPPQPPGRLAQVYQAADLVAVPSYSESFGLVAIEAQACGTPVIAAAVGGLPTAVADGVSGDLVDSHRAEDWTRALADLLTDHERRQRYSAAAPVHAAHFSWQHTVDGLQRSYERAVAQRAPAPERARLIR